MATKFCLKALAICLLFALVTGLDVEKQSLSEWDGELGMDMCPECRSCPPQDPSPDHSLSKQKEVVANGVPHYECPLPEPMSSGYKLRSEEKVGMDRNPESIPRPALMPRVDLSKVELQEYGVDMCPECRCLPGQPRSTRYSSSQEGLEVDVCLEEELLLVEIGRPILMP